MINLFGLLDGDVESIHWQSERHRSGLECAFDERIVKSSSRSNMCAPPPSFPQYQGGSSFPVFTAQGSNPAFNCKIFGKSVHKVYDKMVKGYIYNCLGGMSSKIQFPKDEKTGLQLVQPYLVLQIFVPKGQHFALELRAADTQGTRRKMYFSTSFSELKANPLHCQIPLSMIMRNTWITLALNVPDLFQSCFRVLNYRSLDVIILGPVCKLRKIFTMRNRLAQSVLEAKDNEECLPLEHAYAAGVEATIQVIDTQKIQNLLGISSGVEGRQGIGTPPMSASQKKYRNKIDRHVNVVFGSRMPLPLSTVQINTNFHHDVDISAAHNPHASRLTNVTETQATFETLKVSEPKAFPPQTKVFSSGTGKQPNLKALNPKIFHNMASQNLSDSASFPVQEEPQVNNLDSNPVVIDGCLDLTSKHGRKLQKLTRRKEVKIRKQHQFIRHAQKENCSQNKLREQKELDMKESPPGSPPSGWHNNSDEGSDSFLFQQHFEELPKISRGTLPNTYPITHPFGNDSNHNQGSQTLSENRCMISEGDSYFEKKISCGGKVGLPSLLHWQDHSRIQQSLNNTMGIEKACPQEIQKEFSNDQDLGSEAFKSYCFGNADGLKFENAKPAEQKLASQLLEAGGLLEQNGPFGSTEELWIVHEELGYNVS
ncbi:hypothetical protein GOP47_0017816 [Adiantum capillus-veneris]|uniref:CFA20 domain-containing protein n=1 Tax=Adiantum capillus-veneris TaxID=13818 RepID=A0A9D4UG32_ADICA|nr:hypothetical protein GOP47_0017816 [Adiantum capillus-veneris]